MNEELKGFYSPSGTKYDLPKDKMDKVASPTAGNIPILKSDGSLEDGEKKLSDLIAKLGGSSHADKIATLTAEGGLKDSGIAISLLSGALTRISTLEAYVDSLNNRIVFLESASEANKYEGDDLSISFTSTGYPASTKIITSLAAGTYRTAAVKSGFPIGAANTHELLYDCCLVFVKTGTAAPRAYIDEYLTGNDDGPNSSNILAIAKFGDTVTIGYAADVYILNVVDAYAEYLKAHTPGAESLEYGTSGTISIADITVVSA